MPAKLSTKDVELVLGAGMPVTILIEVDDDEEVVSAAWTVSNLDGMIVKLPGFLGRPGYSGARAEHGPAGIQLQTGSVPTYVQLKLAVDVKVKSKGGIKSQSLTATARFKEHWSAYAKGSAPYPMDWHIPWQRDPKDARGMRALVLMHEMIGQLPEELIQAIGPVPIVRSKDDLSLRDEPAGGKVLPIVHDAFVINTKLVEDLDPSAHEVTPADVEFVTVVLHEFIHAATYRAALWDAHQTVTAVRRSMRKDSLYYNIVGGIAIGLVVTMTAIRKLLMPDDLIGEWSEITGWELGPVAAAIVGAAAATGKRPALLDIGQYLWRIPSKGLNQTGPIRPNLATGWQPLAGALGLHVAGSQVTAKRDAMSRAVTDYQKKQAEFLNSTPQQQVKLQKGLHDARTAAMKAERELEVEAAAQGIVSIYAASDPLEEICETATYLLFNKGQLALTGKYLTVPATHPKLAAKHKFFVDNRMFPSGGLPVVRIGTHLQGIDTSLHLNEWTIER